MHLTPATLAARYGLGRHDLARDPGDLRDLVRAVRSVTGRPIRVVAGAIGCSESYLYRVMGRDWLGSTEMGSDPRADIPLASSGGHA